MPTKIEWAEESWNPVTGCSRVSEGCANCYAERMAKRLAGRCGYPADDPFRVTFHEDKLPAPLHWKKPRVVFVCSMGDLFHEDVTYEELTMVWNVMLEADWHLFLVLTKRPERMREFIRVPLPNVWLGVSAENQARADERIPVLLSIPAAKRFVSIEPMLGPVELGEYLYSDYDVAAMDNQLLTPLEGFKHIKLDWVIVGGESGPGARPIHPDWARSVRDQCRDAGVPFFMKQMTKKAPIPDDLMIREYPK